MPPPQANATALLAVVVTLALFAATVAALFGR